MLISSTQRSGSALGPSIQQASIETPKFDPGVPNYYGPEDGLSQAKPYPLGAKGVLNAATALFCRVEFQNQENLPKSGAHVYSANHSNAMDVPIALNLPVDDIRLMVTMEAFQSPIAGPLLNLAGAYPVNKMKPSKITMKHSVDVVKQGAGNFIFPEGRFSDEGEHGGVGAFKKGAAAAAILGGAESVVPMAIHYGPNQEFRAGELGIGLILGAGVTALGLANPGSPLLSAVGGALTGAFAGGAIGENFASEGEYWDPTPKFLARLKGGATGALAGGIVGFFGGQNSTLSALTAVGGGVATLGLAKAWSDRPVATIRVGEPIPAQPYIELAKENKSQATAKLTTDLHRSIGQMKAELSGVPYTPDGDVITNARPKENFWTKKS